MTESLSAYGRRKGWSQQYVSKLVKLGKIPCVDGKIDPEAADRALAENADPRLANVRAANARRRNGGGADPELPDDDREQRALNFDGMTQNEAQTQKLRIQAKRETLQYEKDVGVLCEVAEVRKGAADLEVPLAQFDGIPDRLASRLAAETDVRKVHAMLTEAIQAAKQGVADYARALVERLGETRQ